LELQTNKCVLFYFLTVQIYKNNNTENQQRAITPKVWWFLSTALLLNEIYLLMKFQVSSLNTFWVILRKKIKNENEHRTYEALSYGSCALHVSSMRSIYLGSFMLMPCIVLNLCSGQKRYGRTNWLTDGFVDYYMPPFEVVKCGVRALAYEQIPRTFDSNGFYDAAVVVGSLAFSYKCRATVWKHNNTKYCVT